MDGSTDGAIRCYLLYVFLHVSLCVSLYVSLCVSLYVSVLT